MPRKFDLSKTKTRAHTAFSPSDQPPVARIPLSQITDRMGGGTRPLNMQHIIDLADSIAVLGLITPLTVDRYYRLLAGGHRRAALQYLAETQPEQFTALFADGIPIRVMDVDAETDTVDALQIEIEENTQRRNYTAAEIREAAQKLEAAGYERLRGRPREDQRSLKRELMQVFRLSEVQIRRYLNNYDDKGSRMTTLSDQLTSYLKQTEQMSRQIGIPASSEELQAVQQEIARLMKVLKRAIARHSGASAP